jgi:hypothetical protein
LLFPRLWLLELAFAWLLPGAAIDWAKGAAAMHKPAASAMRAEPCFALVIDDSPAARLSRGIRRTNVQRKWNAIDSKRSKNRPINLSDKVEQDRPTCRDRLALRG